MTHKHHNDSDHFWAKRAAVWTVLGGAVTVIGSIIGTLWLVGPSVITYATLPRDVGNLSASITDEVKLGEERNGRMANLEILEQQHSGQIGALQNTANTTLAEVETIKRMLQGRPGSPYAEETISAPPRSLVLGNYPDGASAR